MIKPYTELWPDMLNYDNYVEPFFGGGAIFCWIRNNQKHKKLNYSIGDTNTELMSIISSVRDTPEDFTLECMFLANEYLSLDKANRKKWYYLQREKYWTKPTAARLYVLMRTGFNGLWQESKKANGLFGTASGLLNQTKLEQIIDRELIYSWSNALTQTNIHVGGYDTLPLPESGRTLIYLDPPYRDSFNTYSTGFSDNDQRQLVAWFKAQVSKGHKVIMSNRCVDGDQFFEELLCDVADFYYIDIVYTVGRRKRTADGFEAKPAQEILVVSRD